MGVLRVLESVHFYRHVPRDLSQGTASGGVLSLLAAAAMAYLFFSDLAAFLRVDWNHEVHIDQVRGATPFPAVRRAIPAPARAGCVGGPSRAPSPDAPPPRRARPPRRRSTTTRSA